jgi:hypothetical protein
MSRLSKISGGNRHGIESMQWQCVRDERRNKYLKFAAHVKARGSFSSETATISPLDLSSRGRTLIARLGPGLTRILLLTVPPPFPPPSTREPEPSAAATIWGIPPTIALGFEAIVAPPGAAASTLRATPPSPSMPRRENVKMNIKSRLDGLSLRPFLHSPVPSCLVFLISQSLSLSPKYCNHRACAPAAARHADAPLLVTIMALRGSGPIARHTKCFSPFGGIIQISVSRHVFGCGPVPV